MDDRAGVTLPASVQVSFAHAALQHLAKATAADVLHIKGIAARSATGRRRSIRHRRRRAGPSPTRRGPPGCARTPTGGRSRPTSTPAHRSVTPRRSCTPSGATATSTGSSPVSPRRRTQAFERLWRDRHDRAHRRYRLPGAGSGRPAGDPRAERRPRAAPTPRPTSTGPGPAPRPTNAAASTRLVTELGAEVGFAAGTGDARPVPSHEGVRPLAHHVGGRQPVGRVARPHQGRAHDPGAPAPRAGRPPREHRPPRRSARPTAHPG